MQDYPHPFIWVPEGEYHAASRRGEYVSSHLLADFRRSPILYKREVDGIIQNAKSDAFFFGSAVHKLVLEGSEAFNAAYLVAEGPVNPKTNEAFGPNTKAYREWAAAQAPRLVISPRDMMKISNMNLAVQNHPDAARLLSGGFPEGTVRANWEGVACQIRIDWFNPQEGIVDFKSCEDLDRFEYDAKRYGYGHQGAFYRSVLGAAAGTKEDDIPFHIIACEKSEPFRCGVWKVSGLSLDTCTEQNRAAVHRLIECRSNSSWPTGYEQLRILSDL